MPLSENISSDVDIFSSEALTQPDSNSDSNFDSNSKSGVVAVDDEIDENRAEVESEKIGQNQATSQTQIGAETFESIENESNENLSIITVSTETRTEINEPVEALPVLISTEGTALGDLNILVNTTPETGTVETGLLEIDEKQNESVDTGESFQESEDFNQSLDDKNSQTDSAEYSQQFFQQSDESQDFLTGNEHTVDGWSLFLWNA